MIKDEFKPHLLVVEDARDIREPLARYLREHGYRATTAADAAALQPWFAGRRSVVGQAPRLPPLGSIEVNDGRRRACLTIFHQSATAMSFWRTPSWIDASACAAVRSLNCRSALPSMRIQRISAGCTLALGVRPVESWASTVTGRTNVPITKRISGRCETALQDSHTRTTRPRPAIRKADPMMV